MRRRGRVDANHAAIVKALRQVGASVQSLADIGKGCPDLLVGWRFRTWLFEVKDGSKPPSARKLTADEENWIREWNGGLVFVVESPEQAIHTLMFTKEKTCR